MLAGLGPANPTTTALCKMPGWLYCMEACLRDTHCPTDATDVMESAVIVASLVLINCRSCEPATLIACQSLFATFRKMIWPDQGGRASSQQQCEDQLAWILLRAVRLMCPANNLSPAPEFYQGNQRKACNCFYCYACSTAMSTDGGGSRLGPCANLAHQLHAAIVASVVMLHHRRSGMGVLKDTEVLHDCLGLSIEMPPVMEALEPPVLKLIVSELLNGKEFYTVEGQALVAAAWEGYGIDNFNGRLLPGCCNRTCTNMEGASEVSLPTQLCSGCRMARYCSVECQKSAWVQGGHKDVCARQAQNARACVPT